MRRDRKKEDKCKKKEKTTGKIMIVRRGEHWEQDKKGGR